MDRNSNNYIINSKDRYKDFFFLILYYFKLPTSLFSSVLLELLKECDIIVCSPSGAWVSVWQPGCNSILAKSDVITQVSVALKLGHLLLGGSGGKNIQISDPSLELCQLTGLSIKMRTKETWAGKKSRDLETPKPWSNPTLPLCNLGHSVFSEHLFLHL